MGISSGLNGGSNCFLRLPAIAVLNNEFIGGDFHDDPLNPQIRSQLGIGYHTASKAENIRIQIFLQHLLDCFAVILRNCRHTRLNAMDAHLVELLGNGNLLLFGKRYSRLLLAVP